jgi:hypothetical protein
MFLLWQSDDPAVYLNNQCIPGALCPDFHPENKIYIYIYIYIDTFFITLLFKFLIEIVVVIIF